MFGTIGTQELVFIFILALVLFGPKKLPEIGRTIGKALSEFRRASSELKATFDRELNNLEAETKELKEIGTSIQQEPYNYNYDYSSYDSSVRGLKPRRKSTIPRLLLQPLQAHPHLRTLNQRRPLRRKAPSPRALKFPPWNRAPEALWDSPPRNPFRIFIRLRSQQRPPSEHT